MFVESLCDICPRSIELLKTKDTNQPNVIYTDTACIPAPVMLHPMTNDIQYDQWLI